MAEGLGISRLRFQGSETTAASSSTRYRLELIRKGTAFFAGKDSGLGPIAPRKDVLAGAAVLLRRLIERTKVLGHGIFVHFGSSILSSPIVSACCTKNYMLAEFESEGFLYHQQAATCLGPDLVVLARYCSNH